MGKKVGQENYIMTKLLNRTFLNSFLKMESLGIKFGLFCTHSKPLVQKSANFVPSGTILKVVQNSSIYIFFHEIVFFVFFSH